MTKTAEQKLEFSSHKNFDEAFPIINPNEIFGHKLMAFNPKTECQKKLMKDIWKGLLNQLPAFRVPCMAPSEENGEIVFKPGNKPAVGHSVFWWDETWKRFMPSKNSRSGTEVHYAAFLAHLMKYLIDEKNYSVTAAWEAVCNDSCHLGHYWNSEDAKHDFELTGSRKVGAFFDLANTYKILKKEGESCFLRAGGCYGVGSGFHPLAVMSVINGPSYSYYESVGWLVLDV